MHRGVRWNARTVCLSCLRTRCVDRAPLAASRQRPPDTRTGRSEVVTDTLTRSRISAATQISSFYFPALANTPVPEFNSQDSRRRGAVPARRLGVALPPSPRHRGAAAPSRPGASVLRAPLSPRCRGLVSRRRGPAAPPRCAAAVLSRRRGAVPARRLGGARARPPPASMLRAPRHRCTF